MSVDDPIVTGTRALLVRRREMLAQGAEPLGLEDRLQLPPQEKLGIDAPLAGFLTSDTLLESGATWPLGDEGPVVVESEVAVEIGPDGRSIVALMPAIELADQPDLELGVDAILAGNIFHRGVAFGPRAEPTPRERPESWSTARRPRRSRGDDAGGRLRRWWRPRPRG